MLYKSKDYIRGQGGHRRQTIIFFGDKVRRMWTEDKTRLLKWFGIDPHMITGKPSKYGQVLVNSKIEHIVVF